LATKYLDFSDALIIHLRLVQRIGETRYGGDSRPLIESALARPQQVSVYDNADIVRQAAALYFGFIKNHPRLGGNKRTATALVDEFLYRNDYEIRASVNEIVELVLAVEADRFNVEEEDWLRGKIVAFE